MSCPWTDQARAPTKALNLPRPLIQFAHSDHGQPHEQGRALELMLSFCILLVPQFRAEIKESWKPCFLFFMQMRKFKTSAKK